MALLHQIQESVVQEDADLGSVLLKLRLLASRLGGDVLEEWVKHESEGYPADVAVPSYRVVAMKFTGTFSGPFGSGIRNAPIPSNLVEKHAGKQWVRHEVRQSISSLGELLRISAERGPLGIDASNLILLLQDKIYPGLACNSINAEIPRAAIAEIKNCVRSKVLELTLELEKSVPAATDVSFGAYQRTDTNPDAVRRISQQIIYGNVTNSVIASSGTHVDVNIEARNIDDFIKYLVDSGIPTKDASEIARIVQSEGPSSSEEPFGENAKKWIGANINNAVKGTWKIGVSVAVEVLKEAALRYYGIK